MRIRSTVSVGVRGAGIVDVVPLVDAPSSVLVSCSDGSLTIVDVAGARIERRVSVSRGGTGPNGIVAVERDLVVRCGWEMVDAIDLETGSERWVIDEGDHSLDFEAGGCWASPGEPYAVLPNGQVIDTRSGAPAAGRPFVRDPGNGPWTVLTACTTSPSRGLLAALDDGSVLAWDARRSGANSENLSTPPGVARAVAWMGDRAAAVIEDGSVHLLARGGAATPVRPPLRRGGEVLLGIGLAASDDARVLAIACELQDGDHVRYVVEGVDELASPARRLLEEGPFPVSADHFTAAHFLPPDLLVVVMPGRLFGFRHGQTWAPLEMPALAHASTATLRVGSELLVGDAAGALHLIG